jgi:hypothetical protein
MMSPERHLDPPQPQAEKGRRTRDLHDLFHIHRVAPEQKGQQQVFQPRALAQKRHARRIALDARVGLQRQQQHAVRRLGVAWQPRRVKRRLPAGTPAAAGRY